MVVLMFYLVDELGTGERLTLGELKDLPFIYSH